MLAEIGGARDDEFVTSRCSDWYLAKRKRAYYQPCSSKKISGTADCKTSMLVAAQARVLGLTTLSWRATTAIRRRKEGFSLFISFPQLLPRGTSVATRSKGGVSTIRGMC